MELERHNEGQLQAIPELFHHNGTDSSIHHLMIARKRAARDRPASHESVQLKEENKKYEARLGDIRTERRFLKTALKRTKEATEREKREFNVGISSIDGIY